MAAEGMAKAGMLQTGPREGSTAQATGCVCMHVLGTVRTDARVMREATTLARAGFTVCVVDVEHDRTRPHVETLEGVRVEHLMAPSWFVPTRFKPWFLVKAARILIRGTLALLRAPADVYHAQDVTALPGCYLAARLRRKPLIFDAHELPLVDPHVTRWRRLHALAVRLLRIMMRYTAGVITVSPPIARELAGYGGPPAVLVRNIPAYQPPVASDRLRERLGLSRETRIALYQGNLQPDRGLDGLIRAARFLDPSLVVVLMGRGAIQPELEELIAREGVSERVRILPPVPYSELLAWTASADVGLIIYPPGYSPNVRMCLPNKLFEYVMAGLPVLASPLDAVAEILQTYEVGRIVRSLDPEALGRAISALLADPDALTRMRRNATAAAQRDLRWERESQRLFGLYHAVLYEDGFCRRVRGDRDETAEGAKDTEAREGIPFSSSLFLSLPPRPSRPLRSIRCPLR